MSTKTLRSLAMDALAGVGDETLGQWEEWTGRAFHVRRRLRNKEQEGIGQAVDIRGTAEGRNRINAAMIACPHVPLEMFAEEIGGPHDLLPRNAGATTS